MNIILDRVMLRINRLCSVLPVKKLLVLFAVLVLALVPVSVFANVECAGLSPAKCAEEGMKKADPQGGSGTELMPTVQIIINVIFFILGLIAVVMIIVGGISYSTSQGDTNKVKKAKDTIMFSVIGLVVALLAFAIVNFVLGSLGGSSSGADTSAPADPAAGSTTN